MPRIIQCYGLFWERSKVTFGTGTGHKGSLVGHFEGAAKSSELKKQKGIYILYEGATIADQRVVYVGQTDALLARLRNHTNNHLWNRWQRFSWFGFLKMGANRLPTHQNKTAVGNVTVAEALDIVEATQIVSLEPLLNKQGPQWHGAVEYFQGEP